MDPLDVSGGVGLEPGLLARVCATGWGVIMVMAAGLLYADEHQSSAGGQSVRMEDIVVTAEKIQDYIEDHPRQVTVMTREQIAQGAFSNLDQVLNTMPGVEVKKSGSGLGSRISIRGSGNSGHILVLINGCPVNSTQYGGVELESIPLSMVSRVDVFKPPVPVWLGPGASAGAVNIILADARGKDAKKRKNSRIGFSAGSYGKAGLNASHLMAPDAHKLRLTASANHNDGRRTNNDRDSGSLSLHWDLPEASTTRHDVNLRLYRSEHGSPGPTYNPTPDARQTYQKGAADWRSQGVFGENGDFEFKTYLDITRLEDRSQTGLVSTLDAVAYGVKTENSWNSAEDKWALRLSGNAGHDRIDHTLSGRHHREHAFLGVQGDRRFDALTATSGARCDYTTDFGFQPAGNVGVGFRPAKATMVKLNAGYTVNIPTFGQLYQPSHGAIDQVRGNPDLDEERIWSFTAGVTHEFAEDRSAQISLFREESDDLIVYLEDEDMIKRPVNMDQGAYRQGVEVVVNWKLGDSGKLDMSYIRQESRNRENDNELTYTPNHKARATLHWRLWRATRTETTFTAAGEQFSDLENTREKKVDGYRTVDLKIIHPFQIGKSSLEAFVHLDNLLDESFESHHGYPDDGFRVTVGANLDF